MAIIYGTDAVYTTYYDAQGDLVYNPREWQVRNLLELLQGITDVDSLVADTSPYVSKTSPNGSLVPGVVLRTLNGFTYEVAEEDAQDHHLQTAGGVKLYVADDETTIQAFGAKGDGVTDDYDAFRIAAASGVRKVKVPKGTYLLDNAAATGFERAAIIGNTLFDCELGTEIHYTGMQLPVFTIANSVGGGIRNARFLFTGDFLTTDPVLNEYDFMDHCGVLRTGRGGANTLRYTILTMDSDYYVLENLSFVSATPGDLDHIVNGCIFTCGHGSKIPAKGGIVRNIHAHDCIMGHLAMEQELFDFGPYVSSRRAGYNMTAPGYAPGHVVYLSGYQGDYELPSPNYEFDATIKNGVVRDVLDLGEPITAEDGLCLATMAVKGCERVSFGRLTSHHPEGLHQSFTCVRNCTFAAMTWSNTSDFSPKTAVINTTTGDFYGNHFEGITLYAPDDVVRLSFNAGTSASNPRHGNTFENIRITSRSSNPAGGVIPLLSSTLEDSDINLDWRPSDRAADSGNYLFAYSDNWNNDGSNHVNIIMRGQNVNRLNKRVASSGKVTFDGSMLASGSSDLPYTMTDLQTQVPSSGKGFQTGTYSSGGHSFTYQLPGAGIYSVDVVIWHGSTSLLQARYEVIATTLGGGLSQVQQVGTTISAGANLSELGLTVDTTGLLTISYSKGITLGAQEIVTWTRKASLTTD